MKLKEENFIYDIEEQRNQLIRFEEDESQISYFSKLALEQLAKNPEDTRITMEEVLRISQKNNYKNASAEAYLYLGWYHYECSDYKLAIKNLTMALELFKENNNKNGLGRGHNALMATYMHIGLFEFAVSSGIMGLEVANEIGDKVLWITLVINTAIAYTMFNRYQEAFEMVNRIKQVVTELDSMQKISIACIMSEISISENKLNEAYYYCMEAYETADKNHCEITMVQILNIKAKILHKHGNYIQAYRVFGKALSYGERYKQKVLMTYIYLDYAECLCKDFKYNRAMTKLLQAKEIAESLELNYQLKNIYKKMSEIHEYRNEFQEAYGLLKSSNACGDKITNFTSSLDYEKFINKRLGLKAQLYKELYTKTESLSKLGQMLTANLNLKDICNILIQEIPKLICTDYFGIAAYQKNKGIVNYELAVKDTKRVKLQTIRVDSHKDIEAYCIRKGNPVYMGNADKQLELYCPYYKDKSNKIKFKSGVYIPLKVHNQIIGLLVVASYKKYAYDHQDINIMEMFAPYVAIGMWNAKIFSQVQYFASYDELTQILNRRQLFKMGREYLHEAKIKHQKLSLIMFDIDYFKQINDAYGHAIGDSVIKKVVECAKSEMKVMDIMGRYGGEEFMLVLPGEDNQSAYHKAELIREKIMHIKYKKIAINSRRITASFGVYEFNCLEDDFLIGTKRVDDALYKAKNMGRNKVVCYTELSIEDKEKDY